MFKKKVKARKPEPKVLEKKKPTYNSAYPEAESTARYYGFVSCPIDEIEKQDIQKAKSFHEGKNKEVHPFRDDQSAFGGFLEEKICIIRHYIEKKFSDLSQPPMFHYDGPIQGNPHIKKIAKERTFNIEIIGNAKSIADAIVIETSYIILKEHYPDMELTVNINSIGDKDSIAKFTREVINYYKKNLSDLSASCRASFKKDPFSLLACEHEKCMALAEESPKPMTYLSEPSRIQFKEVLEYLESLNIPYMINHSLVGSRSYCTGTLFEIKGLNKKDEKAKPRILAIGERYNGVARKIFGKKEVPAVGAAISIDMDHQKFKKVRSPKTVDAKFYFIQLGYEAKLKSLSIIETLRKSKISVMQSLSRDKMTSQLESAEKKKVPYVLIVGQKEAKENSVTVRNMANRAQETIQMKDLVEYLRNLK